MIKVGKETFGRQRKGDEHKSILISKLSTDSMGFLFGWHHQMNALITVVEWDQYCMINSLEWN